MARLDTFLRIAADQSASDLHFHAGKVPQVRYHGELSTMPFRVLSEPQVRAFLDELLTAEQQATLDRESQVDFAYELDGVGRFRGSVCRQSDGLSAVFRVIPTVTFRAMAGLEPGGPRAEGGSAFKPEQATLLGPRQGQADPLQARRSQVARLAALEDGLDDVRRQESERQAPTDVALIHAVARGQVPDRECHPGS